MPPYLFLRTIVDHPNLAKLTKFFRCEELPVWPRDTYNDLPISNATWRSIRTKIEEASSDEEHAKYWYQAISDLENYKTERCNAINALIICLLPNLKKIDILRWEVLDVIIWGYRGHFLKRVFERAKGLQAKLGTSDKDPPPYCMSKLSSISIAADDGPGRSYESDVHLSVIIPYLELPSVKNFFGHEITRDFEGYRTPEAFTSQVEDLCLEQCGMKDETLRGFLGSCSSLRKFSYEWWAKGSGVMFYSDAMIKGLMASINTLEVIEIDVAFNLDGKRCIIIGPEAIVPPFSFINFRKLREISVNAYMILGPPDEQGAFLQRIPRSLESLTLTDCRSTCYTELQTVMALVRQKEEFAPELKYLKLVYENTTHPVGPVPKEMVGSGLVEECKKAGVQLILKCVLRAQSVESDDSFYLSI